MLTNNLTFKSSYEHKPKKGYKWVTKLCSNYAPYFSTIFVSIMLTNKLTFNSSYEHKYKRVTNGLQNYAPYFWQFLLA
jgi:hypothetical protein